MKRPLPWLTAGLLVLAPWLLTGRSDEEKKPTFPTFRMQEIETNLGIGYAVLLVDVNGDGKKDIVVVDRKRVVWYENPTWKRRTIIEGQTRPENVCIAAHDVDGDGQVEFVLGAGWEGLKSEVEGPLYLLKRGKSLDEPWNIYPIGGEPSVHRIRFADLDGDGHPSLIVSPLLGPKSSKAKNWEDVPVRLLAYKVPKDPVRDRWTPEVIDDTMHVMHNFYPVPAGDGKQKGMNILTASYEGVHLLSRDGDKWARHQVGKGNQDNPKSNRGSSEVKRGKLKDGLPYIATIEPWHGHQVVVYTPPGDPKALWNRQVLDDRLRWGHAVWCADLDGDGDEELIVGVRDDLSQKAGERCGVRIYKASDIKNGKWDRHLVDEGGVAVEDLAAADLDGDGRIDIVAVGRQTKNIRIYWNEGKK
jgi:hypothetical protein